MKLELQVFMDEKDLPQPELVESNKWSLVIGDAIPLQFDVRGIREGPSEFNVVLDFKGAKLRASDWKDMPIIAPTDGLWPVGEGTISKHLDNLDSSLIGRVKPFKKGKQQELREATRPEDIDRFNREIVEISRHKAQVDSFKLVFDRVKYRVKLQYRVFVKIAGKEVDLFTTKPNQKTKSAGK